MIVLAGGSAGRFGANKVYAQVDGRPLLWYSLTAIAHFDEPLGVVLAIRSEDQEHAAAVVSEFEQLDIRVVTGGATRHESEQAGLAALAHVAGNDLIGIHDAARPFLTVDLWLSCVEAAGAGGGAIPVLSAGPLALLDRGQFFSLRTDAYKAQTPQVFRADRLRAAFADSADPAAADSAETVMRREASGVAAVAGDSRNIKVTFPSDLKLAAELAKVWRDGRWLAA